MIEEGHRAVMLYLVQRNDCGDFRIASDIDPLYNDAFQTAITKGVEAICYSCKLRTNSITIDRPLPVVSGIHKRSVAMVAIVKHFLPYDQHRLLSTPLP